MSNAGLILPMTGVTLESAFQRVARVHAAVCADEERAVRLHLYGLTLVCVSILQNGGAYVASFDAGLDEVPEWYEEESITKWPTACRAPTPEAAINGACALAEVRLHYK